MDFTLEEVREQIALRGQWESAEYIRRIDDAINAAYYEIWNSAMFPELQEDFIFEVPEDGQEFALPQVVNSLLRVVDLSNNEYLPMVSPQEQMKRAAGSNITNDPQMSARPTSVALLSSVGVWKKIDITHPTQVSVVSDVAGDLTTSVTIEGFTGFFGNAQTVVRRSENIQLNGTTPVFGLVVWDVVNLISKDSDTVGVVTIDAEFLDSGGSPVRLDISSISPDDRVIHYNWFKFSQPVAAGSQYSVLGRRKIRRLRRESDVPFLPSVGQLLVEGGYVWILKQQRDFAKALAHEPTFRKMLDDYIEIRLSSDTAREIVPDPRWLRQRR